MKYRIECYSGDQQPAVEIRGTKTLPQFTRCSKILELDRARRVLEGGTH